MDSSILGTVHYLITCSVTLCCRIDIKEEYFLPSGSAEKSFIEQYREQFGKTTQFMELTIENSIEYHDHDVQNNIFDLLDYAIVSCQEDYCSLAVSKNATISSSIAHFQEEGYASRAVNWLAEFAKFEKASIYDVNPVRFDVSMESETGQSPSSFSPATRFVFLLPGHFCASRQSCFLAVGDLPKVLFGHHHGSVPNSNYEVKNVLGTDFQGICSQV